MSRPHDAPVQSDADRRADLLALLEEDFLVGGRYPFITAADRRLAAELEESS